MLLHLNVFLKSYQLTNLISTLLIQSLPGFTLQCGLEYTGITVQTIQDKHLILLLDNNFRAGISSVMGDRYVKSD